MKQKKSQYSKKRAKSSAGLLREQELTNDKISTAVSMIKRAVKQKLDVQYVLMDSWFVCESILKAVRSLKTSMDVVGMVKMAKAKYTFNGEQYTAKELAQLLKRRKKVKKEKSLNLFCAEVKVEYKSIPLKLFFCKTSRRGQRLVFHENKMDLERESLLRLIGFNFRLMEIHDWEFMLNKLLNFKKQFGHVNITESYNDTQLHNWIIYQRKLYWKGKLDYAKVEKLKSVGVEMRNKTLNRWEDMYEQLIKFKNENGHLYVCSSFGAKKELVNFVKVLRRTKDTMSKERKEKLNNLGFNWNPQQSVTAILNKERANEQWLIRYEELKEYKQQFGTSYIVSTSKNYKLLANWVSVQRNSISKLSEERILLLNEIDFFKDNQQGIKR